MQIRTTLACLPLVAMGAGAEVLSVSPTGGDATAGLIIAPPTSVGNDNFDDSIVRAFNEQQNVLLTEDLVLDDTAVDAGTRVSSHYIVWDPIAGSALADITFADRILGVASTTALLANSDTLGAPGTAYLNPSLRGLESTDGYSVNGDTVSIDFDAGSPGDVIRVITIPAPGALAPLGALAMVGAGRRRR